MGKTAGPTSTGRSVIFALVLPGLVGITIGIGLPGCYTKAQESPHPIAPLPMTLDRLEAILKNQVHSLQGPSGQWRFSLDGISMAMLTSVEHDRMRIIAPILEETRLTETQRKRVLEANFHTTLDARYATSDGVVYAAFIHPLSPLSPKELRSALRQVAQLVKTFGSTYSSGGLRFSNPRPPSSETRPRPEDTVL